MFGFKVYNSYGEAYVEELNDMLVSDHTELEIGYIEPGHGTRGKQRWSFDDKDPADMYQVYSKKGEIILWMFRKSMNNCV